MPDMSSFDGGEIPDGFDASSFMPDRGGGGGFSFSGAGFGMGSSDVKLQYIDDQPDSYSNIWNNAKTEINEADQNRLINSLEKLSAGEAIENVVDIEQVIRYFVVHNYVCNDDSYTGMMVHNYYLYEEDGRLAMIPWDYNLGYGTFGGGNATSTVNTPIDSPVSGGTSDRPMLNWIFENDEYTEMYHQYFAEFMETVDIAGIIDNAYELIKAYVEKDPTAFYTYEEFEAGVETLRQFCELRCESISMQLENGETTSNMSYVDASSITLSDMGSMNTSKGGFRGDMSGKPGKPDDMQDEKPDDTQSEKLDDTQGEKPDDVQDETLDDTQGEKPDNMSGEMSGDTQDASPDATSDVISDKTSDKMQKSQKSSEGSDDGTFPERPVGGGAAASSDAGGWIWIAISVLILGVGLIIAKKFRA